MAGDEVNRRAAELNAARAKEARENDELHARRIAALDTFRMSFIQALRARTDYAVRPKRHDDEPSDLFAAFEESGGILHDYPVFLISVSDLPATDSDSSPRYDFSLETYGIRPDAETYIANSGTGWALTLEWAINCAVDVSVESLARLVDDGVYLANNLAIEERHRRKLTHELELARRKAQEDRDRRLQRRFAYLLLGGLVVLWLINAIRSAGA